ncbi:hypothetical protein JCGZ_07965 [Jatropha curcas]|uniref:Uncharacterized protein n=1 Tax=Jatropha curcas TaxID=180498 RepID=A0A067LHT6_JATCU|nr:hypothetical protein JCGZ_07965 [Jatropha curcas]
MGSADVQILFEHSEDEAVESRVGEVKGRKDNIKIADIAFDIDEGELLDICYMYDISLEYMLARPSDYMRENEPLDSDSIMLYEEDFRPGVRLSLSEPLSFFNEYNITVSQLHPNGLRFLCGNVKLAHQDGKALTAWGVRELYHFQIKVNEDHYFLQAKIKCNIFSKKSKISSFKN